MAPNLHVMNDVNYMNNEGESEDSPEVFLACAITRAMAKSANPPVNLNETFLSHDNPPLNSIESIINSDNDDPVRIVLERDRLIMEQQSDQVSKADYRGYD